MCKSKVKLSICGSDYSIVSDDSESYVMSIGDKVNDKMNDILSKNPKLSISMAAVLSALEFCDELYKSNEKTENFRSQIKDYVDEIFKYRDKSETDKIAINKLNSEIESLNEVNEGYKEKISELNNEIESLNEVNEGYKEEISELNSEIESLSQVNGQYREEIEQFKLSQFNDNTNHGEIHEIVTLSLLENEIADSI